VCEYTPTPYLHNGGCVSPCPDGYYHNDEGSECVECDDNCKTCHGLDYNHCDTCDGEKYIKYVDTVDGIVLNECVEDCGNGYYINQET